MLKAVYMKKEFILVLIQLFIEDLLCRGYTHRQRLSRQRCCPSFLDEEMSDDASDFIVRNSGGRLLAGRQKISSKKIGKNEQTCTFRPICFDDVFTRESSYCFQRVLAIAIPSVCLSYGWISQEWCKLGSPNLQRRLSVRL